MIKNYNFEIQDAENKKIISDLNDIFGEQFARYK